MIDDDKNKADSSLYKGFIKILPNVSLTSRLHSYHTLDTGILEGHLLTLSSFLLFPLL